jgi:hypothetical protein
MRMRTHTRNLSLHATAAGPGAAAGHGCLAHRRQRWRLQPGVCGWVVAVRVRSSCLQRAPPCCCPTPPPPPSPPATLPPRMPLPRHAPEQPLRSSEGLRWVAVASSQEGWMEAAASVHGMVSTPLTAPPQEPYSEGVACRVSSVACRWAVLPAAHVGLGLCCRIMAPLPFATLRRAPLTVPTPCACAPHARAQVASRSATAAGLGCPAPRGIASRRSRATPHPTAPPRCVVPRGGGGGAGGGVTPNLPHPAPAAAAAG